MSDETRQDQRSGRKITVAATGGSADALELAALDEARKFFGTEARLEVQRDYSVITCHDKPEDARYYAHVTVCEI